MITHSELCLMAEDWLYRNGCGIVIRDPFKAKTLTGEAPDAIGWAKASTVLIEVKVSRSDFLSDKRKKFRVDENTGMGDHRIYLAPQGIIREDDLPSGWGLLEYGNGAIRRSINVPKRFTLSGSYFSGCKKSETIMLLSALRRIKLRGNFEDIYDSVMNLGSINEKK